MTDRDQTPPQAPAFDFSAYPADTLFLDRRTGLVRREPKAPEDGPGPSPAGAGPGERRIRKERRRRIDPTTFEKQYTEDEVEFMNAIQQFKVRTGKPFPTHGEVLRIARALGYRQVGRLAPPDDGTPPGLAPDRDAPDDWMAAD